jgi:UDP:flavonoid glycosyltransferase YjiC (YdhE family)
MWHRDKEKEYIAFYEAKKKYYLATNKIKISDYTEQDSLKVEKMATKDPAFTRYLDSHVKDEMIFTVQQKCKNMVGQKHIDKQFDNIKRARESAFRSVFKDDGTDAQVKMVAEVNGIPFNGFSFYKINYKGDIPNSLRKSQERNIRDLGSGRLQGFRKVKGLRAEAFY